MSKVLNIQDVSEEDRDMFKKWGKVNAALTLFSHKSTESTFKFLYGKDEGERLWKHYIIDCSRDFHKFQTYLTTEQRNDMLINTVLNDKIYIQ